MIIVKTQHEIELMRKAGRISAHALQLAGEAVRPGITTGAVDKIAREYIERQGATPSFLGYNGFPACACISVNNEVIHGIPSSTRVLEEGDIVSIDLGARFQGYHGDNAATFACGRISQDASDLINATRESLYEGIQAAQAGGRLGDIGNVVQQYVENRGYSVVRDFVGHGVGAALHEDPSVPNFGKAGRGVRLTPGMTLAIEPMINQGSEKIRILADGWTVLTVDGKLSAHFEHSVLITQDGPVILTQVD